MIVSFNNLFDDLDDRQQRLIIANMLFSLIQTTKGQNPKAWIDICRHILRK